MPSLSTVPVYDDVWRLPAALPLENGQTLKSPTLAFRQIGSRHLPAILVLGNLNGGRDIWQAASSRAPGWWQALIGPDKALNPACYQILAVDLLGAQGSSTSPKHWAGRNRPFPHLHPRDQARALAGLLEALGISRLESILGASYGGLVALALSELYPSLVRRVLAISASHLDWPVADWEQDSASRDAEAYACLAPALQGEIIDPKRIRALVDLIGFSSDAIMPISRLKPLHRALPNPGRLVQLPSPWGHQAFLHEAEQLRAELRRHLGSSQSCTEKPSTPAPLA